MFSVIKLCNYVLYTGSHSINPIQCGIWIAISLKYMMNGEYMVIDKDLNKIVDVFEVYEEIAEGFSSWRIKPWPIAVLGKSRGGIIVDLGAGSCINGIYVYSFGGKYILCIDVSYTMGFLSRRSLLNRDVVGDSIAGDMLFIPIKDNSVDVVLAIASIHHIPSKFIDKVFAEIVRISVNGALLIITSWSWRQPRFVIPTLMNIILKLFGLVKSIREYRVPWRKRKKTLYRYYYLYTLDELLKLCRKHKLKVLSYGYTGYLRNKSDNIFIVAKVVKNYG